MIKPLNKVKSFFRDSDVPTTIKWAVSLMGANSVLTFFAALMGRTDSSLPLWANRLFAIASFLIGLFFISAIAEGSRLVRGLYTAFLIFGLLLLTLIMIRPDLARSANWSLFDVIQMAVLMIAVALLWTPTSSAYFRKAKAERVNSRTIYTEIEK